MTSLAVDLAAILAGVRRPGDFFVSGTYRATIWVRNRVNQGEKL